MIVLSYWALLVGVALQISHVYGDESGSITDRKKDGGAKIISESSTNIYFQGLHKTNATDTAGQEKSCLLAAQDKAEGWSFRLAVLDTPAKMKMVKDAMNNKILGFSQVGAYAPDLPTKTAQCKDNVSSEYFFWSTGTPVAKEAWVKGEPNNCNYNHAEKWAFLGKSSLLVDYYDGTESAPLCEYYKNSLPDQKKVADKPISIVELTKESGESDSLIDRKKDGGAQIISASDSNIFFQGLNEVNGGNTADTEKSCLVAAQDAQEGWSFRLAVLDTPAKIQMVLDAYNANVMNGISIIGAKAVAPRTGTLPDPQNFFWSTGTPVDGTLWGMSGYDTQEPNNYSKHEDYVDIDENAQLHDIDASEKYKPLCEYYKLAIVERKMDSGAKIISASDSNIYFQGLNEVNGGNTADTEKSCLVAAQDAQEGWSFRLAVLDTPAKIQMVHDAYNANVLSGGSIVGANAVVGRKGTIPDPQNFFWSTGTPVDETLWGMSGYDTQEPNNYSKQEDYVYIDDNAQLHDIDENEKYKPLCEYYKPTIVDRKKDGGATIISAADSNIYFQGLSEVNGGQTAETEQSCLVAPQDAQEGWSFRIAVLDTPAKIQMMVDAYKAKVLTTRSYIGASAVGLLASVPYCKSGVDPEYFFWSTGAPVDRSNWGKDGTFDEPDNCHVNKEEYVFIDVNAKFHDVHKSANYKPLCEYYRA